MDDINNTEEQLNTTSTTKTFQLADCPLCGNNINGLVTYELTVASDDLLYNDRVELDAVSEPVSMEVLPHTCHKVVELGACEGSFQPARTIRGPWSGRPRSTRPMPTFSVQDDED